MPSRRDSARGVSSLDALSTTITSYGTSPVWAAIALRHLVVYASLLKTGMMIETSGAGMHAPARIRPRAAELERDFAQHAGTRGTGHLRDVAGVPEQRLVGQHGERDRFLGFGVDTERVGGRDRNRVEQLAEVVHQREIQRAAAADVDLGRRCRERLAVAARDRLGREARERRQQVVEPPLEAREQRAHEAGAEE